MKEIRKYKGKSILGNEWVYGYYVPDVEWAKYYIYYPKHTGVYIQIVREEVDLETVGQCTGLQDKDGNYIYEGDILMLRDWGNYPKEIGKATMTWDIDEVGWRVQPSYDIYDIYDELKAIRKCSITGNIHDEPAP